MRALEGRGGEAMGWGWGRVNSPKDKVKREGLLITVLAFTQSVNQTKTEKVTSQGLRFRQRGAYTTYTISDGDGFYEHLNMHLKMCRDTFLIMSI